MKTFEVPSHAIITAQGIDDIVTTALEGGINYWCDAAELMGKWPDDARERSLAELLSLDRVIRLSHDGKWALLTRAKLIGAVGRAAQERRKSVVAFVEEHDAADADLLVQLAVFGKVLYG